MSNEPEGHPAENPGGEKAGRSIAGDTLEHIETKTDTWQKVVIAVGAVLLIAIGFSWQGAGEREDLAAKSEFIGPLKNIVVTASRDLGLSRFFGQPDCSMRAGPKWADVRLEFPSGPLSQAQAEAMGRVVAGALAKVYVNKGYAPRALAVEVSSTMRNGGKTIYGKAIYNGDLDKLEWEPAG